MNCRSAATDRLAPIESICGTTSDAHAGGHSVLRVGFVGGGCLYYKPRPVTGEWLWHALLQAIAHLHPELRLSAARVLTNDGRFHYGWAESVFPEEDSLSENSNERSNGDSVPALDYWHVAGTMLCLAQHARLTDLHLGNIVATPWGPVVTDAECLATPNLPVRPGTETSLKNVAIAGALESIVSTSLLPIGRVPDQPDISGLFGHAAPVSRVKLPAWAVSPEGRYHSISVDGELVAHPNAPNQTTAIAVLPRMLSGYRHAAELLMADGKHSSGPVRVGARYWKRRMRRAWWCATLDRMDCCWAGLWGPGIFTPGTGAGTPFSPDLIPRHLSGCPGRCCLQRRLRYCTYASLAWSFCRAAARWRTAPGVQLRAASRPVLRPSRF